MNPNGPVFYCLIKSAKTQNKKDDLNVTAGLVYLDSAKISKRSDPDCKAGMSLTD